MYSFHWSYFFFIIFLFLLRFMGIIGVITQGWNILKLVNIINLLRLRLFRRRRRNKASYHHKILQKNPLLRKHFPSTYQIKLTFLTFCHNTKLFDKRSREKGDKQTHFRFKVKMMLSCFLISRTNSCCLLIYVGLETLIGISNFRLFDQKVM